jgi:hypothetical protein
MAVCEREQREYGFGFIVFFEQISKLYTFYFSSTASKILLFIPGSILYINYKQP